jgi:hypothetical protein
MTSLAFEADKVLFEIYRDPLFGGKYRVVYFTELDDHNREQEFNNAMRGDHVLDGFLKNFGKDEAKRIIGNYLSRMNDGEEVAAAELAAALRPYMP